MYAYGFCSLVMQGSFLLAFDSNETLLSRNTAKRTDPNRLFYFPWYPSAFSPPVAFLKKMTSLKKATGTTLALVKFSG